ncbi:MAG: NAD-dependent epimerase/dehydratase family protein [Rhodospirillaceae bacterium]
MNHAKVLVLGAAGFIGYGITRFLAMRGAHDLTVVDDFSTGVRDEEFEALCSEHGIRIVNADLSTPLGFHEIEEQYDHVYVMASVVGVNRCIEEPDEVIRINTGIIQNTTEWMRRNRPGRVLFASSSENYAATTDLLGYAVPTPEEVPLAIADTRHPRFTYAVTKILGESAFFAYGQRLGIHATVVRYQNTYGPRMGFKHAIPHIIERIFRGEDPVRIYGHDQTRAFTYRDDAVQGTVLAMESEASNQQVYHVGTTDEITIDSLTRAIGRLMGYSGEYVAAPTYPGSVSRRCPDISKAARELGYTPSITLEDGLSRTIGWYSAFFASDQEVMSGGFRPPEALDYSRSVVGER